MMTGRRQSNTMAAVASFIDYTARRQSSIAATASLRKTEGRGAQTMAANRSPYRRFVALAKRLGLTADFSLEDRGQRADEDAFAQVEFTTNARTAAFSYNPDHFDRASEQTKSLVIAHEVSHLLLHDLQVAGEQAISALPDAAARSVAGAAFERQVELACDRIGKLIVGKAN
jgi:hypothetical protein